MSEDARPECFYCGALVWEKDSVGDHMPVPRNCGGTQTVPCCSSCHHMKDNYKLLNWPVDWFAAVMRDLPLVSRETKLFLAKVMRFSAEHAKRARPQATTGMNTTTPSGKLFFTIMSGIGEFERAMIVERVKAGLDAARARGVELGRKPLDQDTINELRRLRQRGESIRSIASACGVSVGAVHKYATTTDKDDDAA